ncbi:MAG: bifunctional UDP-N-acetylglucosamine diphosphorylase/glucosamine-1-phosphate N-acetyltransferase GlmU [Reyranella sp.]|uniref:bifunctional UDP-N-acetylglucosamine diphosphorylase/glucosamine-1-phosphate N-acetyltransferase GlmU n=1 Tax=Reyranella sp. TaxID=1929291 RepID=UPI001AC817AA|nr:bifunctional UDP-N-acetylglucosamine diphosphorylase/glucosamine-1-phosphate N-acetyltransferase GlmU [Reyranella sp.]MBN9087658.1 bifunctional UDP-N-acetylglucosamine diphosphorylase/glucosamine-1-phosphate N-acetyltransferase GlmU [Reyranella sp.]
MKSPIAVVVLAAGAGTRMKSALPKVLHSVAGRPMLAHVLAAVARLKPAKIVGVISPGAEAVAKAFAPHPTAVQKKAQGTGDAVKAVLPELRGHSGPVLVVYGDSPLITAASLQRLVEACRKGKASVGVLGFTARDPSPYGRLVVKDGTLERIVESKDANAEEKAIAFSNSGVTCIAGTEIAAFLGALRNDNVKSEFYLTDVVGIARAAGHHAIAVAGEEAEFMGVNSRAELAMAERAMQQRLRSEAMAAGVTMLDPDTVWLSADTRLGSDVTIGPNVRFGPGVTVASNVCINAFCDIEGARIASGAIIGPFARLRPGSDVAEDVHIGNFVELKATRMRRGAKANHLAYLGDSDIGAASNIGAGTIFVNYDGYGKHRTVIGDDVFVGSNSALVAPVKVGKGANVTAGSVITDDVPPGALAFGRARQETKKGRAGPLRAKLQARAAAAKARKGK